MNVKKEKYWIVLSIALVVSLVVFYLLFQMNKESLIESYQSQIEHEHEFIQRQVNIFKYNKQVTIEALKENKSVNNFIQTSSLQTKKELERVFINQIKADRYMMQIRIIDPLGNELIKVDQDNRIKKVFVVPQEKLQNKSHRDYFKEFSQLDENEIGFTRIDLNKEFGEIEKPYRETIRIATPIIYNKQKYLIVINYYVGDWLNEVFSSSFVDIYLIDDEGYFISHALENLNWSKYLKVPLRYNDTKEFEEIKLNDFMSSKKNNLISFYLEIMNHDYYIAYKIKERYVQSYHEQIKKIGLFILLGLIIPILPLLKIIRNYVKRIENDKRQLQEREVRLNSIFNNTFDAMVIINKQGLIQQINQATQTMFGYNKDELIGKNVNILVPRPHHDNHDNYIKNYKKEQHSTVINSERDLFGQHKSGQLIPISLVITKMVIHDELFFIGTVRNISVEKHNKKLFETVFKTSPLGIALVLEDGTFWRTNTQFTSIIGYSEEEILNLTFQDITHPNDLEKDLELVHQLIRKEINIYSFEKRYIHKKGHIVWANITVTAVYVSEEKDEIEYFIAVIEDISERKKIFENLQETQKSLVEAEKISSLGHWDWNQKENTFMCSEMMKTIFNLNSDEDFFEYETMLATIHPDDKQNVKQLIDDTIRTGKPFDTEYRILVNNQEKIIHAKGQIKKAEEDVVQLFGTCQDITQIKHLVNKEKQQELLLMQQSKLASMGEMVAAIAHQWRQPLNSIGITMQDLTYAYKYEELDETYLHNSKNEIMQQLQLMSDTIDEFRNFFTKTDQRVEFGLYKNIEEVIKLSWAQFKAHNITIQVMCEDSNSQLVPIEQCKDDVTLMGSPSDLKQVVLNLLNNSKDAILALSNATPEQRFIEIIIKNKKSLVEIIINDLAGGINTSDSKRIFEPYYTTKEMGTGLGLYICQTLIEHTFSGQILYKEVTKETLKGSSFIISLPKKSTL